MPTIFLSSFLFFLVYLFCTVSMGIFGIYQIYKNGLHKDWIFCITGSFFLSLGCIPTTYNTVTLYLFGRPSIVEVDGYCYEQTETKIKIQYTFQSENYCHCVYVLGDSFPSIGDKFIANTYYDQVYAIFSEEFAFSE